jgi:hypothetical protein
MGKGKYERVKPHVNVGTLGHVDSRKTILTAALAKVARMQSEKPMTDSTPAVSEALDALDRIHAVNDSFEVCACLDFLRAHIADLTRQLADARRDAERLNAIERESWDLRCFDCCQGEDVGWRVIAHFMAEPRERVVAEIYTDNPREAIDAAMSGGTGEGNG